MLCRLGLRAPLSADVYPTLRVCLNKPSQTRSIYSSKSLGRIVAADDRMNRDTTCRRSRPLLFRCNGEACTVRGFASLQASSEQGPARSIHEGFYCNRRYAATTSLTAGGLAAQSVNILFQVCLLPSRLRAPVSRVVSAVSSRTLVNTAG